MIWLYSLISVIIVSLISLIGVFTLTVKEKSLHKILILMVAFSVGALIGDTFLHLLPEAVEENGFSPVISTSLFGGVIVFFILEKFLRWRHCHESSCEEHPKHIGQMNLIGDTLHNLIDGIIIGSSFVISVPLGVATSLAVILHEIPQELGDFGVLLHSGFTKRKAIIFNLLSACASIFGAALAVIFGTRFTSFQNIMIPFTAGGFLYIAMTDLIPELHLETKWQKSALQLLFILLGILIMYSLLLLEKA